MLYSAVLITFPARRAGYVYSLYVLIGLFDRRGRHRLSVGYGLSIIVIGCDWPIQLHWVCSLCLVCT